MPIIDAHATVLYLNRLTPGEEDVRKKLVNTMSTITDEEAEIHDLHGDICDSAVDAIARLDLDDDPEVLELSTLMHEKLVAQKRIYPPRKDPSGDPVS